MANIDIIQDNYIPIQTCDNSCVNCPFKDMENCKEEVEKYFIQLNELVR